MGTGVSSFSPAQTPGLLSIGARQPWPLTCGLGQVHVPVPGARAAPAWRRVVAGAPEVSTNWGYTLRVKGVQAPQGYEALREGDSNFPQVCFLFCLFS